MDLTKVETTVEQTGDKIEIFFAEAETFINGLAATDPVVIWGSVVLGAGLIAWGSKRVGNKGAQ